MPTFGKTRTGNVDFGLTAERRGWNDGTIVTINSIVPYDWNDFLNGHGDWAKEHYDNASIVGGDLEILDSSEALYQRDCGDGIYSTFLGLPINADDEVSYGDTEVYTASADSVTFSFNYANMGEKSTTVITTPAATAPLVSLDVDGKSVQDGTPTPSAPVAIESVDSVDVQVSAGGTVKSTTPIDLQGHELRSLPDGTKDELHVDTAGNVTLVQRTGETDTTGMTFNSVSSYTEVTDSVRGYVTVAGQAAIVSTDATVNVGYASIGSYAGNTSVSYGLTHFFAYDNRVFYIVKKTLLGEVSSAGLLAYINANPIQLTYKLATPQTISLGTIDMPTVEDGDVIEIVGSAVVPEIGAAWETSNDIVFAGASPNKTYENQSETIYYRQIDDTESWGSEHAKSLFIPRQNPVT